MQQKCINSFRIGKLNSTTNKRNTQLQLKALLCRSCFNNSFCLHRFVNTPAEVQRQALQWLQKLCLLNIPVPLSILFDMFGDGIDTLQRNTQGYETDEAEEEIPADAPTSSKKKAAKKKPDPPTLIVEVRSGCLDPDDIYTVHRADSSEGTKSSP